MEKEGVTLVRLWFVSGKMVEDTGIFGPGDDGGSNRLAQVARSACDGRS